MTDPHGRFKMANYNVSVLGDHIIRISSTGTITWNVPISGLYSDNFSFFFPPGPVHGGDWRFLTMEQRPRETNALMALGEKALYSLYTPTSHGNTEAIAQTHLYVHGLEDGRVLKTYPLYSLDGSGDGLRPHTFKISGLTISPSENMIILDSLSSKCAWKLLDNIQGIVHAPVLDPILRSTSSYEVIQNLGDLIKQTAMSGSAEYTTLELDKLEFLLARMFVQGRERKIALRMSAGVALHTERVSGHNHAPEWPNNCCTTWRSQNCSVDVVKLRMIWENFSMAPDYKTEYITLPCKDSGRKRLELFNWHDETESISHLEDYIVLATATEDLKPFARFAGDTVYVLKFSPDW